MGLEVGACRQNPSHGFACGLLSQLVQAKYRNSMGTDIDDDSCSVGAQAAGQLSLLLMT